MENFHVFGVYWKFQLLGVGSRKTNIERGAWAVCRFKGGGAWHGIGGGVFDWGGGGGGGGGGVGGGGGGGGGWGGGGGGAGGWGLMPKCTLFYFFVFTILSGAHKNYCMECRRHKNFRRPEERKTYRW